MEPTAGIHGASRVSDPAASRRTSRQPRSPNQAASEPVAPWRSDTATTAATTARIASASALSRRIVPMDVTGSAESHAVSSTSQWTAFVRSGNRGSRPTPSSAGGSAARTRSAETTSSRRSGHATSTGPWWQTVHRSSAPFPPCRRPLMRWYGYGQRQVRGEPLGFLPRLFDRTGMATTAERTAPHPAKQADHQQPRPRTHRSPPGLRRGSVAPGPRAGGRSVSDPAGRPAVWK